MCWVNGIEKVIICYLVIQQIVTNLSNFPLKANYPTKHISKQLTLF